MPIWAIDPIETRPQVTLRSWAVFEVPLDGLDQPWTRHLAGYALEERQGQVSSPVIQFDPLSGQCITRSGRVYRLFRRSGLSPDALTTVFTRFSKDAKATLAALERLK